MRIGNAMIAATTLAISCGGSTPPELAENEFELRLGQSVPIERIGWTATARELIEDSRCPLDAYCVWAGRVRVAAEFRRGRREVAGVLSSEPDSAVALAPYRFRIVSVTPLPYSYRQPGPPEYRFVVRWTFVED